MTQHSQTAVDVKAITFRRDDWGRLLVTLPGHAEPTIADPVRCFPLTHPHEQISLLDSEGREAFRIRSLEELPLEQRRILEQELAEREFSPIITRIVRSGPAVPCSWDVETDRGTTRFQLDSEDDFRKLPNGTVLIVDANGIRYRIPQIEQLDTASRAILRRFM